MSRARTVCPLCPLFIDGFCIIGNSVREACGSRFDDVHPIPSLILTAESVLSVLGVAFTAPFIFSKNLDSLYVCVGNRCSSTSSSMKTNVRLPHGERVLCLSVT